MIKQLFYFFLGLFLYWAAYNVREEWLSALIFFLVGSVCIYSVFDVVRSGMRSKNEKPAAKEKNS